MKQRTVVRVATGIAAATICYIALDPALRDPLGLGDRLNHLIAFFTFAALAQLGWPRSTIFVALISIFFDGFIEIAQGVLSMGRQAQWGDWFADVTATFCGLLVVSLVNSRFSVIEPEDQTAPI